MVRVRIRFQLDRVMVTPSLFFFSVRKWRGENWIYFELITESIEWQPISNQINVAFCFKHFILRFVVDRHCLTWPFRNRDGFCWFCSMLFVINIFYLPVFHLFSTVVEFLVCLVGGCGYHFISFPCFPAIFLADILFLLLPDNAWLSSL